MKRIALLTCFLLSFSFLFAQYPATQTLGSDSTLIKSKGALQGRLINWSYPDTASANRERISHYPGAQITVGDLVYFRNSDATRWILLGSNSTALNNGLTSTGNITLVDSTLTIGDTIRYTINGTNYVQTTPSVFTINSADSGYYRKDLIYADATGLHKLVGEQDTAFGVKPKLPINSIEITTVDIYGQQIVPPTPTIITPIPNLQQVTNEGNSTTNPIFINSNSIQTPLRITSDFNRSNYLYFKNNSNGGWANTGFLFKNDVTDNPYDEWSGHWFRLMQGSTNSSMIKDGAIIMTNGTGGMKIVSDSGRITFNSGSPAYPYDPTSHPYKEMGAFETDGSFRLNNYKNNAQGDSVLSTDTQGKVVMKKVSVGDIDVLQNTIDNSSFGIKKINGEVKNVVIYADGLTGIGGGTGGITQQQLNDTASAIRNDFPSSSTYTASNGLTKVENDMQLGGSLSKNDTINTNTFGLKLIGNTTNAIEINQFGSGGLGISVSTNSGTGISSQGGNNTGGNFLGSSIGIATQSPNVPLWVINSNTSNSGILNGITIQRTTSTPTIDGFGVGINFTGVTSDLSTTYLGLIQYDFSSNRNYNTSIGRFSLIVADSAKSNNKVFQINGTGQATLNRYGTGLFTGTPTYNLGVDASGNVIEVASGGGGGGTYTASNGLTMVGSDIQLGGTSSTGATITFSNNTGLLLRRNGVGDVSPNTLDILTPTGTGIKVASTAGTAIAATSNSGTAINATSYSSSAGSVAVQGIGDNAATGVVGQSYNGTGVAAYSNFGVPLVVGTLTGNSPLIIPSININRITGTGTNGLGTSIDFYISKTDDFPSLSNQIISKLTNASTNPTSEFSITGVNNATTNTLLTLSGSGSTKLNKYGLGTFTGTAAYNLGVDASGNVIEVTTGAGGGGITQSQLDDTASAIRSSVKPYKVYSAMLSQTGTSAPTAYVLENTIGITPIFIYVQTGDYAIKFPSIAMPAAGKTAIITNLPNPNTPVIMLKAVYIDNKTVELLTKQASDGTPVDNALSAGGQTFIEIRVYN